MSASKPPTLATWMLEHLTPGGENEALAGDLLEEFQHRHSAAWYWRQVLGAMVASWSNELRAEWGTLWTVAFTVVWTYSLHVFFVLFHPFRPGTHSEMWMEMHGGTAMVTALLTLMLVVVPLSIYLAVLRNLLLRAFACGLGVGMLVMIALQFLTLHGLLDLIGILARQGVSQYWLRVSFQWYLAYIYPAIPLLAAMWFAHFIKERSRATTVRC